MPTFPLFGKGRERAPICPAHSPGKLFPVAVLERVRELELGAPLFTLDARMARAATEMGLPLAEWDPGARGYSPGGARSSSAPSRPAYDRISSNTFWKRGSSRIGSRFGRHRGTTALELNRGRRS